MDARSHGSAVPPSSTCLGQRRWVNRGDLEQHDQRRQVDGGAATSNGYIAFLHVTQTAAAQARLTTGHSRCHHSANDSTWSTLLGTFSANGSASVADRLERQRHVNRYTWLVGTRTAGTARVWAMIIVLAGV